MPVIVPVIVGQISTADVRKLAERLKKDLRDDDLVLISSDFVHYGADYDFVPFGAPVPPQLITTLIIAPSRKNALKHYTVYRARP